MAKNKLEVEVEARLTVSDDTAEACNKILDIYCDNQCRDLTKSKVTCGKCVLCKDGYCNRYKIMIYM